jgi:hypothetical protein
LQAIYPRLKPQIFKNSMKVITEYRKTFSVIYAGTNKDVPDHNDRSIDRSKSLDRLIDRSSSKRRSIITFKKQQKN